MITLLIWDQHFQDTHSERIVQINMSYLFF